MCSGHSILNNVVNPPNPFFSADDMLNGTTERSDSTFRFLNNDHPAPRLGPPAPTMPAQQQQQSAVTAPLPPAPDWSSEALLNARKRARSLLSAAGGAGDLTSASSGSTMAKATLGA